MALARLTIEEVASILDEVREAFARTHREVHGANCAGGPAVHDILAKYRELVVSRLDKGRRETQR